MLASHLAFYAAHQISPVRQNIDDLDQHFRRRRALYHQLGILPALVRDRRILEVGPGSGHNALYTASLGPARYLLIEGNPQGVADMRALFAGHPELMSTAEIRQSRIEEVVSDEAFDVVLCEGMLSGIGNPDAVLDRLGALTAPDGILAITCVDHLSHFPETVRRAFAQVAVEPDWNLDRQLENLLPMFVPHLETLGAMSRRPDDWIIDNLVHPGSIIPLINFPEAIAVLASRFDFLASSPRFVRDWRWYKQAGDDVHGFNLGAIEEYWAEAHNLLDHRRVLPSRDPVDNQRLYDLCTEARLHLAGFETSRSQSHLDRFLVVLETISDDVLSFNTIAAMGLSEAAELLRRGEVDASAVAGAEHFAALFGRGQQYLSFCKRD